MVIFTPVKGFFRTDTSFADRLLNGSSGGGGEPNPDPPFRFGLEAVRDAFFLMRETKDLQAWGGMGFIVWNSGYFTV